MQAHPKWDGKSKSLPLKHIQTLGPCAHTPCPLAMCTSPDGAPPPQPSLQAWRGITQQREDRESEPQSRSPPSRPQRRSSICSCGAQSPSGHPKRWVIPGCHCLAWCPREWRRSGSPSQPSGAHCLLLSPKAHESWSLQGPEPGILHVLQREGPLLVRERQVITVSQRPKLKTQESCHKHWSSLGDGVASGSFFYTLLCIVWFFFLMLNTSILLSEFT